MPSQENRERLIGLAVAELFSLWDRVQPRSTRATTEEAAQYAAATAKYLFDRVRIFMISFIPKTTHPSRSIISQAVVYWVCSAK